MRSVLVRAVSRVGSPRSLMLLAATSLLLGLSGPFGTWAGLAPAPRILFWTLLVFLSVLIAALVEETVDSLRPGLSPVWRDIAVILGFVLGFGPVVALLSLAFGIDRFGPGPAGQLALVVLVGLVGRGLRNILNRLEPDPVPAGTAAEVAALPPLMRRLVLPPGASVLAIGVDDHVVEVRDSAGGVHRLRMRLADAVREMDGVEGLYVHRSHWVAVAALSRMVRRDGRDLLCLTDDSTVPVSRSRIGAVTAALARGCPAAVPAAEAPPAPADR